MLLKTALATLLAIGSARALTVRQAPNPSKDGYENLEGLDDAEGGLCRFLDVREHMAPEDHLARSSAPYYRNDDGTQAVTRETITCLRERGITHVISLNSQAHAEDIRQGLEGAGIAYTPIPVEDFHDPTQDDFQRGWESFLQHRRGTLVWCGYGHGRTGTMISALQMYAQHARGQLQEWSHSDYIRNHVERPEQEAALDTLQQRLRSQPRPPSDEEIGRLLAGDFSGLACPSTLAAVAFFLQKNIKRSPPEGFAALRARQTAPAPATADCERARDMLQRQNTPAPCRKVKDIQLGFKLSDDNWSGTFDDLGATLEGAAGKATLKIGRAPSPGFHTWIPVDLQASYNADAIDINGIDKITLNAAGTDISPIVSNDQWQVQDIQIRAQCADPGFQAKNDKLVGLNAWFGHPKDWFNEIYERKTVASFPVLPGDWSFSPPCGLLKELSYDFKLTNAISGGTWDALSFTLGDSKTIALGESVSAGFTKANSIKLMDVFGRDKLDIHDLKKVSLIDDFGGSGGNGDAWSFQGITFSATCADMPKKVEMKKFESVNQWVQHVDSGPAWTGDIDVADWSIAA